MRAESRSFSRVEFGGTHGAAVGTTSALLRLPVEAISIGLMRSTAFRASSAFCPARNAPDTFWPRHRPKYDNLSFGITTTSVVAFRLRRFPLKLRDFPEH